MSKLDCQSNAFVFLAGMLIGLLFVLVSTESRIMLKLNKIEKIVTTQQQDVPFITCGDVD
jgi:hypothetical protein